MIQPPRRRGLTLLEDLLRYAEALGLDLERFQEDWRGEECQRRVRDDFLGGARSGVNGTPTFFINGTRHDGGNDLSSLAQALRKPTERCPSRPGREPSISGRAWAPPPRRQQGKLSWPGPSYAWRSGPALGKRAGGKRRQYTSRSHQWARRRFGSSTASVCCLPRRV